MKTIRILFFILAFAPMLGLNQAFGLLYLEGGAVLGGVKTDMTELEDRLLYQHDGVGLGYKLSGRAGLSFIWVVLGGSLSWSKAGLKNTKEAPGGGLFADRHYDTSLSQMTLGAYLGIHPPVLPFKVYGEYIMKASGDITYSEPKTSQIFTEKDELKGKGYLLGAGYKWLPFIHSVIEYRVIEYSDWTHNGVKRSLPTTVYSKIDVHEYFAGVNIAIDFL